MRILGEEMRLELKLALVILIFSAIGCIIVGLLFHDDIDVVAAEPTEQYEVQYCLTGNWIKTGGITNIQRYYDCSSGLLYVWLTDGTYMIVSPPYVLTEKKVLVREKQ